MSEKTEKLDRELRRAWFKWQSFVLSRGLALTVGWLVLIALVELGIDWTLDLPVSVRVALLGVNIVAFFAIAYTHLIRHMKSYDPLRQALREESEHTDLENLLVAYCQLGEEDASAGMSEDLIRAAKRRAEQELGALRFGSSVRFADLWLPVTFCVCVLALSATGISLRPGIFDAFAHRMFVPGSSIAYPTRTHVAVTGGDMRVRRYGTATATAHVSGEVPDRGQICVRPAGSNWRRIDVTRSGESEFTHTFQNVSRSFDYRFEVGDDESAIHRVTAVPPPHIERAKVRLKYPNYTGLEAEDVSDLNVEVPEGTAIEWELEFDRPVTGAKIVPAEGDPVSARIGQQDRRVRASLTADASLAYRCRFRWTLNGEAQVDETERHFIQVIPDVAPRVTIKYPRHSGKATLKKSLEVVFSATDDHGISDAYLIHALNDGREKSLKLSNGEDDARERSITVVPAELVPDLEKGDVLSYRIEVEDNREGDDGPQRSSSRVMRLQFVSREEYLKDVRERRRRYIGRLRPVYHQERKAYSNMTDLQSGVWSFGDRKEKEE